MTPAPFFQLWRQERTAHAVTKASLTMAQRQFAGVSADFERAIDQREEARDERDAAERQVAELRAQLSSVLDVKAGFAE